MDMINTINDQFISIVSSVISAVESYGWYMLIISVGVVYAYNNYCKSYLFDYLEKRSEQEYVAKYKKNPDLLEKHLNAKQAFVDKLQSKYEKDAEDYKKKMEEKELKKKEELLSKLEGKGGKKLGDSFKPEYNPLMGSGSGSSYKPPKKSCCSKKGCS